MLQGQYQISVVDGSIATVRIRGPHTGSEKTVDMVIDGKLSNIDLRHDVSPLCQSLVEAGLVQIWKDPGVQGEEGFAPGGLLLNKDCHPLGRDNRVNQRLSFIGPPTGMMFFQGTLGRPDTNHQVLNETVAWAKRLEARLEETP